MDFLVKEKVILEFIRALVLSFIVFTLYRYKRSSIGGERGFKFILWGFALFYAAAILDITDNFEQLNRFVVIGDTPAEAFLEKTGYTLGIVMIAYGLFRWLDAVSSFFEREGGKRVEDIKERLEELEVLLPVLDALDEGIVLVQSDGDVVFKNKAFSRILGVKDIERRRIYDLLQEISRDLDLLIKEAIEKGSVVEKEFNLSEKWLKIKSIPIKLGDSVLITLSIADTTAEKLYLEALKNLAERDPLTGVYNRRKFEEIFQIELERGKRYGGEFSIALLDIDHFKRVNDTYGHDVGDEVLVELVKRVGGVLRKVDVLARFGGEEFVVLFRGTPLKEAKKATERIRRAVEEEPFKTKAGEIRITVSIGLAQYPEDGKDLDTLIRSADKALYLAKKSGRNRVCTTLDLANSKEGN